MRAGSFVRKGYGATPSNNAAFCTQQAKGQYWRGGGEGLLASLGREALLGASVSVLSAELTERPQLYGVPTTSDAQAKYVVFVQRLPRTRAIPTRTEGKSPILLHTRDGQILEVERERDGFVLLEERKREEGESLVAVRTSSLHIQYIDRGRREKRSCSCQRLMSLSPSRLGV